MKSFIAFFFAAVAVALGWAVGQAILVFGPSWVRTAWAWVKAHINAPQAKA